MFIVTNPTVAIVKTKTKLSYRRKDIHKRLQKEVTKIKTKIHKRDQRFNIRLVQK